VTIPPGVYDFADLQFNYTMPSGSRLRTNVDFRSGTYFDGRRTQMIVLRFDRRSQKDTIQLLGVRVRTALNTKASGNALIQYNSTSSRLDVNVRLR
jgi:hypothetical protein